MIDRKAFNSISNRLESNFQEVWRNWSSHLFLASDIYAPLTKSVISVALVIGMPATRTGVVKHLVGSISRPLFPKMTMPASCAVAEMEKGESRS